MAAGGEGALAEAEGARHIEEAPLVSIIVPCYNAERWLRDALASVQAQTYRPLELSVWNDASTDGSLALVEAFQPVLQEAGIALLLGGGDAPGPMGCGAAKNRAVRQSHGEFLCFLDADDVMRSDRVQSQLALALALALGRQTLVGSDIVREPPGAQPRYTEWLNQLTDEQLVLQRFCECTLAMPTWFCAREVFDRVGGFSEAGRGTPEDLDFFYRHLHAGGRLAKVREPLVVYRFHEQQESRGVSADAIWALRVAELQATLLDSLASFCIWSAGRDGKRLYRSLSDANRLKVVAFLDVDPNKLAAGQYYERGSGTRVPIVSWEGAADPRNQPAVVCVKRGLHAGFEENLASLGLTEGVHYWHFN